MQNFSVQYNNKTYWISRSVAVAGFIFGIYNNEYYILANRRGEGTPDYQGYWNCPCGYLDYNETLENAMFREIHEETGLTLNHLIELNQIYINSDPKENRQNVTVRYYGILQNPFDYSYTDVYSEKNEIDDIKWINLKDIDNYKWAFNHDNVIKEIFNTYINISDYKKHILLTYKKYFI